MPATEDSDCCFGARGRRIGMVANVIIKYQVQRHVWIHYSSGCPMLVDLGWVGLTLIWVFHHLSQLLSLFCPIPISPAELGS